jgi:hypothetical protein
MDQIIEELSIKEHKNLVNNKYLSKTLEVFLVFFEALLLRCFRDLTLKQLEWWVICFFDKLILDCVLYLLYPLVL